MLRPGTLTMLALWLFRVERGKGPRLSLDFCSWAPGSDYSRAQHNWESEGGGL